MCGILLDFNPEQMNSAQRFAEALSLLGHRGPDHIQYHTDEPTQTRIGHTRLSFFDLTEKGHQPISDKEQEYWISFNGEIYNHRELRRELSTHYSFQGRSDTEVILAGYKLHGPSYFQKLKGMFAFVILDLRSQSICFARDRFGIKPLYYYFGENGFSISSELKPLHHLGKCQSIEPSAISDYLTYRFIPSPKSIWKSVFKLEPAHFGIYSIPEATLHVTPYWELSYNPSRQSVQQITDEFEGRFQQSVIEHSLADVPVGGFQSAGMDSTAISSARHRLGHSINTYSIGFENWPKSEHADAQAISEHLKHRHRQRIVGDSDYGILQKMPNCYDEPIADISILPTYLISELAAQHSKAVMSGEGADELLGGYHWQHELNEQLKSPWNRWRFNSADLEKHYAQSMAMGLFDRTELLAAAGPSLLGSIPDNPTWFYQSQIKADWPSMKALQYLDIRSFMGELVLTKIDRASMAHSLEARVPFLDHELVEFLFQTPPSLLWQKGKQKPLLAPILSKQVPPSLYNRPKQGFVGPDPFYMNRQLYQEGLKDSLLVQQGWIRPEYLNEQLQQPYNWRLWKLLILENWLRRWNPS
jgi:asparagine synthase (glutamine-hydrolysing)